MKYKKEYEVHLFERHFFRTKNELDLFLKDKKIIRIEKIIKWKYNGVGYLGRIRFGKRSITADFFS